jgi:hypothetical protein
MDCVYTTKNELDFIRSLVRKRKLDCILGMK